MGSVPQGSVHGLLLFNIHIFFNDLFSLITGLKRICWPSANVSLEKKS